MGFLKKENFRPLDDEDKIRINKVLDYWYGENTPADESDNPDGIIHNI